VTQVEYAQKKRSFIEKKRYLQDDLAAFERENVNRFEPTLEFLKETIHVGELAEGGKPDENSEKLAV